MLDVPTPHDLRNARKDAGLTQTELAGKLSISQPALSKIESGENDPRLSTVGEIVATINQER